VSEITAGQTLGVEDAALLVSAYVDLLTAQAAGVTVLGSPAGGELVDAAHAALADLAVQAVLLTAGETRVCLAEHPSSAPGSVAAPATSRNEVSAA
jgi:hypothetical protein